MKLFQHMVSVTLLAVAMAAGPAAAADHQVPKYQVNVPPSAELSYSIRSRQSGISVGGEATVRWVVSGKTFSALTEVRAMLVGKILESKSEGAIDRYGLAPASFTEKRFHKEPTATTFDRAAHIIRFSASPLTYPITGGEQDRNSIIWQLISVARAAKADFKPGSDWNFFVAGQRDADPWTFKVIGRERISTPLGELDTLHVLKERPPHSSSQQVDIWLAPQLEWYPVRLRYTDADGDFIEQTLQEIGKQAS